MLKIKCHYRLQNNLWKALITGNNAHSSVIIQQQSCLALIIVNFPSSSFPTWFGCMQCHPNSSSSQLCTYLLCERKLGLALVIFLLLWPTSVEDAHVIVLLWWTKQACLSNLQSDSPLSGLSYFLYFLLSPCSWLMSQPGRQDDF